ncbi:MAG: class I SAM-dependent methyltransferase [Burkholderiales bacterium]|nr:class I SAM-dependent methyltransferase [Burkholderiales bacterium]
MDSATDARAFWGRAAGSKVFAHALDVPRLARALPEGAAVLDYGCGRGRLCSELSTRGGFKLVGADFSAEMIAAARHDVPGVRFVHVAGDTLPFADAQFDSVLLFAVLTCIASGSAQRGLVAELRRVLRTDGLLLVSDYLLQDDARNRARYDAFAAEHGSTDDLPYGVFRVPDGAVLRHHTPPWMAALFSAFTMQDCVTRDAVTMNGNPARITQWWLRA